MDEDQIYRIDHYLGKETVQNIMVFRFANGFIEPLWNRNHIDHVQITVAESVGVEHRGAYYEEAGALRDMIPNHLLVLLGFLAMEPPNSFEAKALRDEVNKVLDAIKPLTPEQVLTHAVRGQYGPGTMPDGEQVQAYRSSPGVDPKVPHRDLRRAQADHGQLALGRRALLSAHRQAPDRPVHRGRHPVQEGADHHVPGHRRRRGDPTCWCCASSPTRASR
jgi:hypothetical protein